MDTQYFSFAPAERAQSVLRCIILCVAQCLYSLSTHLRGPCNDICRLIYLAHDGPAPGGSRQGAGVLPAPYDEAATGREWNMMLSVGGPREDGVISVTGIHEAGGERWGWRTEIEARWTRL